MIDVHVHIDDRPVPFAGPGGRVQTMPATDLPALLDAMDGAGIRIACLCGGAGMLLDASKEGEIERANARLSGICRGHPGRFAFHILVHPNRLEDSLAAIERHAGEAIGVGELLPPGHFNGFQFDTPTMKAIAVSAARHRLPLLLHTGTPDGVAQVAWLAAQVPEGRFVLAHAAGEAVGAGLDLMDTCANVWMDLSVHAWKPGVKEPLLARADRSRLLFGSDVPIESPGVAQKHFRAIGFTEEEQREIAERAPMRLFPKLAGLNAS